MLIQTDMSPTFALGFRYLGDGVLMLIQLLTFPVVKIAKSTETPQL